MMVPAGDTVATRTTMTRLGYALLKARLAVAEVVKETAVEDFVLRILLSFDLIQVKAPVIDPVFTLLNIKSELDTRVAALHAKLRDDCT